MNLPRSPLHLYLLSLPLFYLLLILRAHILGESVWRPKPLRTYRKSERITRRGEEWFAARMNMTRFVGSKGEVGYSRKKGWGVGGERREVVDPPLLCLGVDVFQRKGGVNYLPATLGALYLSLTPSQRSQIHLLLQFKNPDIHPLYEPIVASNLADRVISRPTTSPWGDYYRTALSLPHEFQQIDTSATLDFAHILQRCLDTSAEYIMILEDDVVADYGWFTVLSTKIIPSLQALQATGERWHHVYLMWDSRYPGWENLHVPLLLRIYLSGYLISLLLLLLHRRFTSRSPPTPLPPHTRSSSPTLKIHRRRSRSSTLRILLTPLLLTPHFILFLLQGRHAAFPFPNGLSPAWDHIPQCCSQSFLFSRSGAEDAVARYLEGGYVDSRHPLCRDLALLDFTSGEERSVEEGGRRVQKGGNREGGGRRRFFWKRPVFQHIGTMSSYGHERVHRVRNWEFEGWWI